MAWDTERTRQRLLTAATHEFAAHGLDGTTMAGIAARAGINKERLYKYFGDKRALFETVLTGEMEKLSAAAGPADCADVGEFAGRTFDYYTAHPELARLLLWEGLGGFVADERNRSRHYREKVQTVATAQREGHLDDGIEPAHLVFLLISLSAWWYSVPQLAQMLAGPEVRAATETARRRASVMEAARRLAAPREERS